MGKKKREREKRYGSQRNVVTHQKIGKTKKASRWHSISISIASPVLVFPLFYISFDFFGFFFIL